MFVASHQLFGRANLWTTNAVLFAHSYDGVTNKAIGEMLAVPRQQDSYGIDGAHCDVLSIGTRASRESPSADELFSEMSGLWMDAQRNAIQ